MLETPHERVRLLKAGVDGKTIEKLYIIYNNFKIVRSSIFFDTDKMQIHPPMKKKNKSDFWWAVKIFSLAYVFGVFSIILHSIFPNYSALIILVASSVLIYFIFRTKRKTDWNLLLCFLRKSTTKYTFTQY